MERVRGGLLRCGSSSQVVAIEQKPQRVAGYRVLDVAVLNLEIYNIGS